MQLITCFRHHQFISLMNFPPELGYKFFINISIIFLTRYCVSRNPEPRFLCNGFLMTISRPSVRTLRCVPYLSFLPTNTTTIARQLTSLSQDSSSTRKIVFGNEILLLTLTSWQHWPPPTPSNSPKCTPSWTST